MLTEGDGDEVATGDKVLAHIWIGNGFDQKQAFSTYDTGQPETLTVDEKTLSPVFIEGLEGHTIGSRVAVAAPADEAFGEQGNPQLGIGNKDSILVIIDLMEMYEEPKPTDVPQSKMPTVVEEKGEPTSLDFSGLSKPNADGEPAPHRARGGRRQGAHARVDDHRRLPRHGLRRQEALRRELQQGAGRVLRSPASSRAGPTACPGSRSAPACCSPSRRTSGYGAQEQPNIPANSTLYFVVDIVSAK